MIEDILKIIENVKSNGDKALAYYAAKFDNVKIKPSEFCISKNELKMSLKRVKPSVLEALKTAAKNISEFYLAEKSQVKSSWGIKKNGKNLSQKVLPLSSVGVYVPGGNFSYPSSVLMGAIPARVAGVKNVYVVTPSKKISPEVLAAAYISGVDCVFRVGGPAAVAALAYGTKTIPKVDKIVGPGNAYVTMAKKLIFGDAGIDMLAGPSEIVIIADKKANEWFIKQDLLAQLEHDKNAKAFLIYIDAEICFKVKKILSTEAKKRVVFLKAANLKQAADVSNKIAPEHLELMCLNNKKLQPLIKNAGTVFIGDYTPVALGDYIAGSSHVLPTGRSARFSSGLSVMDFYKRVNFVEYDKKSCLREAPLAENIAAAEGMIEHKKSLEIREIV